MLLRGKFFFHCSDVNPNDFHGMECGLGFVAILTLILTAWEFIKPFKSWMVEAKYF
jgi:hypothetical protein